MLQLILIGFSFIIYNFLKLFCSAVGWWRNKQIEERTVADEERVDQSDFQTASAGGGTVVESRPEKRAAESVAEMQLRRLGQGAEIAVRVRVEAEEGTAAHPAAAGREGLGDPATAGGDREAATDAGQPLSREWCTGRCGGRLETGPDHVHSAVGGQLLRDGRRKTNRSAAAIAAVAAADDGDDEIRRTCAEKRRHAGFAGRCRHRAHQEKRQQQRVELQQERVQQNRHGLVSERHIVLSEPDAQQ